MGVLVLPSRFNQQPQQSAPIDRHNPITAGMVFAAMPGIAPINIVSNKALVSAGSGAAPIKLTGRRGIGAIAPDAGSYVTLDATLGAAYTLFAFGEITTLGVQGSPIDDDDGSTRAFLFRINSTGGPDFIPFTAGGSPAVVSGANFTAADLSAGVAIAGTVDAGGNVAVWGNGSKTTGSLGAAARAPSNTIALLNRKLGGTQIPTTRPVYLCCGWNRVLSDCEIQSLTANPWQIFKAPPRRLWAVSTNGVAASAAWLEANDVASLSASVQASGALSWTEAPDTIALAATASISGAASWIEQSDSASIAASATASASTAWTEQSDVSSLTAAVTVSTSASWSEASDVSAVSVLVGEVVAANAAWTEQSDTLSALATVRVDATAGWAEQSDLTGFSAQVLASAGLAWTEASDGTSIAVTVIPPAVIAVAWTEASDVAHLVAASDSTVYARAPAGSGYTPRRVAQPERPAATSSATRPAAKQDAER